MQARRPSRPSAGWADGRSPLQSALNPDAAALDAEERRGLVGLGVLAGRVALVSAFVDAVLGISYGAQHVLSIGQRGWPQVDPLLIEVIGISVAPANGEALERVVALSVLRGGGATGQAIVNVLGIDDAEGGLGAAPLSCPDLSTFSDPLVVLSLGPELVLGEVAEVPVTMLWMVVELADLFLES